MITLPARNTYEISCDNTYMAKLTLSVDPSVISRAKQYARQSGASISSMVEAYLASLGSPPASRQAPVLRSLRGILKNADPEVYRKHLARKYDESAPRHQRGARRSA